MRELVREVMRIVDALKADALFQKKVQPTLRRYVIDKSYPLDARFQVWKDYCDKEERSSILARGDFGQFGDWVRDGYPDTYERGRVYTWKDFLEFAEDDYDGFTLPVDELMEMLIETNFGSFVMDW